MGLTLENLNREADAMGAYRNARELYQAMVLDADVQDCDNKIASLSSPFPLLNLCHLRDVMVGGIVCGSGSNSYGGGAMGR